MDDTSASYYTVGTIAVILLAYTTWRLWPTGDHATDQKRRQLRVDHPTARTSAGHAPLGRGTTACPRCQRGSASRLEEDIHALAESYPGGMTDQPSGGQQARPRHRTGFVRDVWVNFLANILAAAAIYLVAEATGYIRGSQAVIAISVGLLTGGFLALVMVGMIRLEDWFRAHGKAFNDNVSQAVFVGAVLLATLLSPLAVPALAANMVYVVSISAGVGLFAIAFLVWNSGRSHSRGDFIISLVLATLLGLALAFLAFFAASIGAFLLAPEPG